MNLAVISSEGAAIDLAEVATSGRERRRGLIGRASYDRVMVFERTRQVHTFGMGFAIDVAWCDRAGVVLRTATLGPNRLSPWIRRADAVLEAEAGHFADLELGVGAQLTW